MARRMHGGGMVVYGEGLVGEETSFPPRCVDDDAAPCTPGGVFAENEGAGA